jgi:hypothetical protein
MEAFMKRLLLTGLLLAAAFANPMQADFFQCPPACAGSDNADVMIGSPAMDGIVGGNGNDLIFGGDNRDVLGGEGDDDLIFGGLGGDTLNGGPGNDTLIPGPDESPFIQEPFGEAGNDTIIVLVGETVNCQDIRGGTDFDVLHLIGFGPYIAEYPYGAAEPIEIGSYIAIHDPIAGGYIFAEVQDADGSSVDRINGLATPNVTVLDNATYNQFFNQNCTAI